MKTYYATFRYRDNEGQLREVRKAIQSSSLKDAKITARNIAKQNDWWLRDVITGGRAW